MCDMRGSSVLWDEKILASLSSGLSDARYSPTTYYAERVFLVMKIKTTVLCILTLLIALYAVPSCQAAENAPDITAKSAIVMEALTGKVLYAKAAEERRYPASTTKIMTLITALEYGNLDDMVTASENAANTEGSSLWLTQGEQLSMRNMLYGMMLVSGNDATVSVAEHIAGSVPKFAALMTEKAHAIGAIHSNFVNSSGLPDENHYTTAHDLARITAYGYQNKEFREIVSTKNKVIPWQGKEHDRDLYNENRMLWLYEGANGVKTGYTDAAGRCLVSGANRDGVQLIAVVLDSEHMWDDSIALLNYGFSQMHTVNVLEKGDILKTLQVRHGKAQTVQAITAAALTVPVTEEDRQEIHTVVEADATVEAPVAAGQKLGVVRVFYKNTPIATVDLLATDTIERKSFFTQIWSSLLQVFSLIFHNLA
jgi:D-alanyl-D-alanine carboxypeptidase (penicillin-binding protein 5/6)